MRIINRNGIYEECRLDAVTERIRKACAFAGTPQEVDPVKISTRVCSRMRDGITSAELDDITVKICMNMALTHPGYGKLGSGIAISSHQKNIRHTFSEAMGMLYDNVDIHGDHSPIVTKKFNDFVKQNEEEIHSWLRPGRDFLIDFFGFKTLERAYFAKVGGRCVETPQYMWMRVALGIHLGDLPKAKETYDLMSTKMFTHATPTLFNSGTVKNNLISCFLLGTEDSVNGIFSNIAECANISKVAGGIGVHISNIRGRGSYVRGTGGQSDGILPMLRVYNDTARYINQGNRRNGSFAMYIEPWHSDIFDFIKAKRNHGSEETRARDLFYALWIPDLFMERVETDSEWSLMCPDECPGLNDVYGEEFNKLYRKYESEKKFRKKIRARELWDEILVTQIETGTPYMCYKDHVNRKSNQKNIGTIRSSNLCVAPETRILTSNGYVKISEVAGRKVELWNGEEWSLSKVEKTGENVVLMRVEFSNGGYLECTPQHQFIVKGHCEPLEAIDLREGMEIPDPEFEPLEHFSGKKVSIFGVPINARRAYQVSWLSTRSEPFRSLSRAYMNDVRLLFTTMGINCSVIKTEKGQFALEAFVGDIEKIEEMVGRFASNLFVYTPLKKSVKVVSVKCEGRYSDTYCFGEPIKNQGIFEGVLTKNCSEITLYSDESEFACCNLVSIRLSSFIKDKPDLTMLKDSDLPVKVYGKTGCVYCDLLKCYLGEMGLEYEYTSLDDESERREFFEKHGVNTVPQLMVGSDIIKGGFEGISKIFRPVIDYDLLRKVVRVAVDNLNKIIDINYYPNEQTRRSNERHRPIGIGVQGLADVFTKMWLPYDSEETKKLNSEIFEGIYYYALEKSNELAKIHGAYSTFEGSPLSRGEFQFDLWDGEITTQNFRWEKLRESIKSHGVRNSTLISLMPTASTAQIFGSTESFEPSSNNLYTRRTLAGEFRIIKTELVERLDAMGLWDNTMRERLIYHRGSVQGISQIPKEIRNVYKTAYEISNRSLIDMAADRGKFVCQSQSFNIFLDKATPEILTKIHLYGWKRGLKTGSYYIRSKPAINSQQFTLDPEKEILFEKEKNGKNGEEEDCLMCGS